MYFVSSVTVAVSATTGTFANMAPSIPNWEHTPLQNEFPEIWEFLGIPKNS